MMFLRTAPPDSELPLASFRQVEYDAWSLIGSPSFFFMRSPLPDFRKPVFKNRKLLGLSPAIPPSPNCEQIQAFPQQLFPPPTGKVFFPQLVVGRKPRQVNPSNCHSGLPTTISHDRLPLYGVEGPLLEARPLLRHMNTPTRYPNRAWGCA